MQSVPQIRIFLASPGDVNEERAVVLEVLDMLEYDPLFKRNRIGGISIHAVAWDKPGGDTPMRATMTPQTAIKQGLLRPSECDIVLVLFWGRMGTPLPHPEYQKADGSPYLSGTEWEYFDAVQAERATGKPITLIYRRTEAPRIDMKDRQQLAQYHAVLDFFEQFRDATTGALMGGVNEYSNPEELRLKLLNHLRVTIANILAVDGTPSSAAPPLTPARPLVETPHSVQVESTSDKSQESANSEPPSQPTTGETVGGNNNGGKQEDKKGGPAKSNKFTINILIIIICMILSGLIIGTIPISSEAITIQLTVIAIVVPVIESVISIVVIHNIETIRENLNNSYLWSLVPFGVLLAVLIVINNLPFIQLRLDIPLKTRILPSTSAPFVNGIDQISPYSFHPILNMSEDGWYLIECPQNPSEAVGCWIPPDSDNMVVFGNRSLIKIITPSPTPSPPRTYTTNRLDVTAYDRPGGNKIVDLSPNIPYDLLGISPDRAWYVIGLTSGSRAWITSSPTYGKINVDPSELEPIPTPTDETEPATIEATQTFGAQTATAEYQITQTTIAVATFNAQETSDAIKRETTTAQAMSEATQTADMLTVAQLTLDTKVQTQIAQSFTQTAEAATEEPTPIPTPAGKCSGSWGSINPAQPDTFHICDSLVTSTEYKSFYTRVELPEGKDYYPEAAWDQANSYCISLGANDPAYEYRLPNRNQWQLAQELKIINPDTSLESEYKEWLWVEIAESVDENYYEVTSYVEGDWRYISNQPRVPKYEEWIYFRCVAVPKSG